jgi:hypothetical protein
LIGTSFAVATSKEQIPEAHQEYEQIASRIGWQQESAGTPIP